MRKLSYTVRLIAAVALLSASLLNFAIYDNFFIKWPACVSGTQSHGGQTGDVSRRHVQPSGFYFCAGE